MLAITAKIIPYVKELREITGSVLSAILMQQLDYWFHLRPDGFYKFLSPCDNPLCKQGETWTEELGFSRKEFWTAFDKIGVRHQSKKAFDASPNIFTAGEGVELYYASYHDKFKGLTFYYRNHALLDTKLAELITRQPGSTLAKRGACKAPKEAYGSAQRELTEVPKGNLRKLPKGTYVSSLWAPTEVTKGDLRILLHGHENTHETTTESTRAARSSNFRSTVPEDSVSLIFEHWKITLNHPRSVLDAKRKKAIAARLKEGFSASDLIAAVDGCKADPFSMGRNDRNQVFDDIALICRDANHVEKFMRLAATAANGATGATGATGAPAPKRQFCGKCYSGWYPPVERGGVARLCICAGGDTDGE